MKEGFLKRICKIELPDGKILSIHSIRINSMADDESGAFSFKIKAENFSSNNVKVKCFIDGDISNKDSNYGEKFWEEVKIGFGQNQSFVWSKTKKTAFEVYTGQKVIFWLNGQSHESIAEQVSNTKFTSLNYSFQLNEGDELTIQKFAVNLSSENHKTTDFEKLGNDYLARISTKGFDQMLKEQASAWAKKWAINDIVIEGDIAAQQGIRFNIFQLNQTYTGEDERLNIGPKGFTGEKYGGSTYWDTEAYCVPFYLATAPQNVAKNLLIYRWKQLDRAIENAQKLGFSKGAALYPMVTMNGEECHNEWEITFEEIHRNGDIAYAIKDYVD